MVSIDKRLNLFVGYFSIHLACRYCFTHLIQQELNSVAMEWNIHQISCKNNSEGVSGKPDVLYFQPECQGSTEYGFPVDKEDISICRDGYRHITMYF
jgi:hypothetical protein